MANVMDFLVRVTGNGSSFRKDMKLDQAAVDEFAQKVDGIRAKTVDINLDDADAQAKVDEFRARLDAIQKQAIYLDVNDDGAVTKFEILKADLDALTKKAAKIHVDVDTRGDLEKLLTLRAEMDALTKGATTNAKVNAGGGGAAAAGGAGILGALIMSLLPLASPIGAAGVGGLMGLASAFTAATAGAVGFAAVAVPNIKSVTEASTKLTAAQDAYNRAVTSQQKQAALLQEKQAVEGLDSAQLNALTTLRSFQSFWKVFTKSFENPVLNVFTQGLRALQTTLTGLQPTISAAGYAFGQLFGGMNASLQTRGAKEFFTWLDVEAGPAIISFGTSTANILKGLGSLMMAFTPISHDMQGGLVNMTAAFAKWSAGLSESKSFQDFIDYVKAEGPQVLTLIGSLGTIIVTLLKDMAPVGAVMLRIINYLARLTIVLTNSHPRIVQTAAAMMSVYGAYRLTLGRIPLVTSAMSTLGTSAGNLTLNLVKQGAIWTIVHLRMLAVAAAQGLATAAQWALNVAMDANPIGLVIIAIAGLITGIVLLVTHWKTVIHWLQEAWHWFAHLGVGVQAAIAVFLPFIGIPALIIAHWGPISAWFSNLWSRVEHLVARWGPRALLVLMPFIGIPLAIYQHWGQIPGWIANMWGRITRAFSSGVSVTKSDVSGMIRDITSYFGSLPANALHWGENLIHMFGTGIMNKAHEIENAVKRIADRIAGYLGFHSPAKEGPGADADTWAPNLMKMFIGGIDHAAPRLRATMNKVLAAPKYVVNANVAHMISRNVSSAGAAVAGQSIVHNHYDMGGIHVHNPTVMNQRDITNLTQRIQRQTDRQLRSIGVQTS